MKFGIVINEGPYQHQASDSAFFFTKVASPPQDDRHIPNRWSELGKEHDIDLVLCVAAAQRRGIVDPDEMKRHKKDANNIAENFRISGLGQLIEAGVQADRLITFGD
jgi:tRNA 2-thiouridine synthesizing protein D